MTQLELLTETGAVVRFRATGGRPPNLTGKETLKWHGWNERDSGCWEFGGFRDSDGYGQLAFGGGGQRVRAHRLAYETWVGPIPDGLVVRHRCDNPPCINPSHLDLGSIADNNRDKVERGRQARGQAHGIAKLTSAQVSEIRAMYAAGGIAQRRLASQYGVNQRAIWSVVNRVSYLDVP